jgi:hypothetical protein
MDPKASNKLKPGKVKQELSDCIKREHIAKEIT